MGIGVGRASSKLGRTDPEIDWVFRYVLWVRAPTFLFLGRNYVCTEATVADYQRYLLPSCVHAKYRHT